MLQELRKLAAIPCIDLLRNKIIIHDLTIIQLIKKKVKRESKNEVNENSIEVYEEDNIDDQIINLLDCAKIACSNVVSTRIALAAQMILDVSRKYSNRKEIKWRDLDWDYCISPLQLPCLQNKVFRMSFYAPMTQKSNIIYLLSKTILQRCMTRKFAPVCISTFAESKETCVIVKQLVLISLLGNYEHSCPVNRPSYKLRMFLYEKLMDYADDADNHTWFLNLVENCPYLIEFCLRDFVSFQLLDDPSYNKFVGTLINTESFHKVLYVTMDKIRGRLNTLFELDMPLSDICVDLSSALDKPHTALLSLSYRLPKTMTDLLSALTSVRGESNQKYVSKRNMVPVSKHLIKKEEIEVKVEVDDEADFMLAQEAFSALDPTIDLANQFKLSLELNKKEEEQFKSTQQQWSVLAIANELVSPEILQRLHKWVSRIAPTRRDSLFVLITLFPLLGIKVEAARKLYFVMNEYRAGSLNHLTLPNELLIIQKMDMLCYDVLQIVVDLMKLYTRVTLVRTLPSHYIKGQFEAARNAFVETKHSPYAVYDAFDFVFCSVCNSLYSMTREHKISFLKTYMYGYR